MLTTKVTIGCPIVVDGNPCDKDVVVEVTGRYIPAWGYDPPEYPNYEIVSTKCAHNDSQIAEHPMFSGLVEDALWREAQR